MLHTSGCELHSKAEGAEGWSHKRGEGSGAFLRAGSTHQDALRFLSFPGNEVPTMLPWWTNELTNIDCIPEVEMVMYLKEREQECDVGLGAEKLVLDERHGREGRSC